MAALRTAVFEISWKIGGADSPSPSARVNQGPKREPAPATTEGTVIRTHLFEVVQGRATLADSDVIPSIESELNHLCPF